MKRLSWLVVLALAAVGSRADDATRAAQQSLKEQGFYYGEVNGEADADTAAAVRRFQLRNGLEATGKLDDATQQALSSTPAVAPTPAPGPSAEPEAPAPAATPRENDHEFLDRESRVAPPRSVQPPASSRVAPPAGGIFSRTPFETAPPEVQRETIKQVQARLARQRFYDGPIDGVWSEETRDGVLRLQREEEIERTGRLDMETLREMEMLPGQKHSPFPMRPPGRGQVYRGVIVH
jgi:peptidoglycan hydrolase-like protein with peptidoglycan-binding domain